MNICQKMVRFPSVQMYVCAFFHYYYAPSAAEIADLFERSTFIIR